MSAINQQVEADTPLFRLDSTEQEAAVQTALKRIAEVDAEIEVATTELAAADGVIQQAQSAYQQALDELQTKEELFAGQFQYRDGARDRAPPRRARGPRRRGVLGNRQQADAGNAP